MPKAPKTVVLAARVDARNLATIVTAFTDKKIPIKSRSHLNSLIIETFCESLVKGDIVDRINSTEEALEILASIGIDFEVTLQKNILAIAKQISSEKALEEVGLGLDGIVPKGKVDEALRRFKDTGK